MISLQISTLFGTIIYTLLSHINFHLPHFKFFLIYKKFSFFFLFTSQIPCEKDVLKFAPIRTPKVKIFLLQSGLRWYLYDSNVKISYFLRLYPNYTTFTLFYCHSIPNAFLRSFNNYSSPCIILS